MTAKARQRRFPVHSMAATKHDPGISSPSTMITVALQ